MKERQRQHLSEILPSRFWDPVTRYGSPEVTLTRQQLQDLLLDTGGKYFACGGVRKLKHKHIGAGVYLVTYEIVQD
jgi:hypothetical protein